MLLSLPAGCKRLRHLGRQSAVSRGTKRELTGDLPSGAPALTQASDKSRWHGALHRCCQQLHPQPRTLNEKTLPAAAGDPQPTQTDGHGSPQKERAAQRENAWRKRGRTAVGGGSQSEPVRSGRTPHGANFGG